MTSRVLTLDAGGAAKNLAMEEALFRLNSDALLRVWGNERSVIIGRGQLAEYETDVAFCAESRVPIVRRMTAGGAVYHGPGNLNWSIFLAGERRPKDLSAATAFRVAGDIVVEALKSCGVDCARDAPNRVVNREGKISGMAAYVSRGGMVCHGTLLCSADLSEAQRLTTPRELSTKVRYVRSKPMKMANTSVTVRDFTEAISVAASVRIGTDFVEARPTAEELETADRMMAVRYGLDDWNLGDPFRG